MNTLIVGGTGFIGSTLARELVDRGHTVTVLSRSPETADLLREVQTAVGDDTDYDSIAPAFTEQDAVVNLVALSPLFTPPGGNEMHESVHLGGTETSSTPRRHTR